MNEMNVKQLNINGMRCNERDESNGMNCNKNDEMNRNELGLPAEDPQTIRELIHLFSEVPDTGYVNFLAREMQVYEILKFMRSPQNALEYGFTPYHFDLENIFGAENFRVLSADRIEFGSTGIRSPQGDLFSVSPEKSIQYGPAI